MRPILLIALLSLAPSACQSREQSATVQASKPLADKFIEFAETLFSKRPKTARKESIKKVPNRHDENATDIWHTCVYAGYTITYCEPGAADKNLLSVLTMTKAPTPLPNGVRFGQSRMEVQTVLGKPNTSEQCSITYEHSTADYAQTATFFFKNGALVKIEWRLDMD